MYYIIYFEWRKKKDVFAKAEPNYICRLSFLAAKDTEILLTKQT